MSNIDWDFITGKEGYELVGYVPAQDVSKSGVTIASGFDLGERSVEELKSGGLPKDLINKLKPFLGLKGQAAADVAGQLQVTEEEADKLNKFAKEQSVRLLKSRWKKATGTDFEDLPTAKATVIASVAYQYGNLSTRTPNFWEQVTAKNGQGDWNAAVKNLRNFGDDYGNRRNAEADYFEQNTGSVGAAQPLTHTVQQGEWLSKIAADRGIDVAELKAANPDINPDQIQPGQVLQLPAAKGATSMVDEEGNEYEIANLFEDTVDFFEDAYDYSKSQLARFLS